ncbi:MAG: CaiB/BaiF CoA-transferase family protein [Proteobacteria bacterium]|nr:CaiB/BaiF CoA-transferase family protein [Pseudomonadota bacterium]MCZ6782834.1 CaiB/BaiF CoA-transferase family protein [Pseudomonadota bacterium]
MTRPAALEGVLVLDFSTVGPAARCARILADYGARVVKIGAPPSKSGVQIEPVYHAYGAGRGYERIRLDLKSEAGVETFFKLVARADVVIESYRPGVADRLGIGYADVRRANPRVVYCSTSGYGQDGPASQWAGHDLNYLAVGGYLHMSGRRADGGPALPGATVADSAAGGMHAALAILAALLRRERTGEGEHLDVSVAEGVLSLMSLAIDEHLATGAEPGPGHDVLSGRYAFYDVYACGDGGWLAVAAIEPRFYANLCKALGLDEWIPRQRDDAVQDEIRADFRAAFAARDRDDWLAELAAADACVSPVYDIAELARDPQFAARGAFGEAHHPQHGAFRQVAPALAGMDRVQSPVEVGGSASDAEALLREVGLPADEIEALCASGAVA